MLMLLVFSLTLFAAVLVSDVAHRSVLSYRRRPSLIARLDKAGFV